MTIVIGGEACQRLASIIDSDAIIFSIRSDERLPQEIEKILESKDDSMVPMKLCIVGDIVNVGFKHWKIRNYLSNELSSFIEKDVELLWYDGDLINNGFDFYERNPIHKDIVRSKDKNKNYGKNELTCESAYMLGEIFNIVGVYPGYSVDKVGNIVSLNLSSGGLYRKSILKYCSRFKTKDIFDIISEQKEIKKLDVRFSENLAINCLPPNLDILDCRGCSNIEIDEVAIPSTLKVLNLSACDLQKIPDFVYKLRYLEELLVYKNNLTYIDCNKFGKALNRLSVYRNKIQEIVVDMHLLEKIKSINAGSNPLKKFYAFGGNSSRMLEVNLRKINTSDLDFYVSCQYDLKF